MLVTLQRKLQTTGLQRSGVLRYVEYMTQTSHDTVTQLEYVTNLIEKKVNDEDFTLTPKTRESLERARQFISVLKQNLKRRDELLDQYAEATKSLDDSEIQDAYTHLKALIDGKP